MSDAETRPRRRRFATLGVLLGVAGALLLLALATAPRPAEGAPGDGGDDARDAAPLPVRVVEARLEPAYEVGRSYVGRVEASRRGALGFELGGRLDRVDVREGDVVAKGDVLARLDTDRLDARRQSLEAEIVRARADLTLAEATRGRVASARELDAVSPQALDEAELGLAASRAALDQARAALREIDVEIAKSRLLAPYDAVVAARDADEGQVLAAGTPVLRVLERAKPEARIGVAGDAAATLAPGQRHRVRVGDRTYDAELVAVLPARREDTRSVEVLLELDAELVHAATSARGGQGDGDRPRRRGVHDGDLVRLELTRRLETPGFWLPSSALTESRRGLWATYVVGGGGGGPDGVVERRELEVLHQEAERVFVRGTLQPGERVVDGGLHRLVPGQRVHIAGPYSTAGGAS